MTAPPQNVRDVLTQSEAEERARRVSDVGYVLDIELNAGSQTYAGQVTITCDVAGEGPLFVDFAGKTIRSLEVNGTAVTPHWNGYRLVLPPDALAARTTVRISYENAYDDGGDGFHRFVDPEDGLEDVYSNFEPYFAHRLFPCFDQPDLKATYALTVTAPSDWRVVANTAERLAIGVDNGRSRHEFEETKRFSTYLFALVAGPFAQWRGVHGAIPIGLYCRQSLAPYLDADEIFELTHQGLDFFSELFDFPYPFGKYDQIFVPEFSAGAMENVGAVMHNELMIDRDPPTENQRVRRADFVFHEMAHMWFGDLVTLRWWNDLWLNESFATYMSYLAMTRCSRFTGGWLDFNARWKSRAYRQDQLVTTHPISGLVHDTDETFLNFDGITYGKGASALRQLAAAIGETAFTEGVRSYLRRHQFGNATLAQFLHALEAASGQPLQAWSQLWLETAGANTIGADWAADGERITRLRLQQSAPEEHPTLRPHALEVGLFRDTGERIEATVLPATIAGAEAEVPAAVGLPRPDLVFPNYGDLAYTTVALDPQSVEWVVANIERIEDELLRQLLWATLWNMVRDQQLSSRRFLATVRAKAGLEPSTALLNPILNQALAALDRLVPEDHEKEEAHLLFDAAWQGLNGARTNDGQISWARTLISAARAPEDIRLVAQLVDGEVAVGGFSPAQEMRWELAARCVAFGLPEADARVAVEDARNPSDRGRRAKLRCETSVPDLARKEVAWERIGGEGHGSAKLTAAGIAGFNWANQRVLLTPFVERFFAHVPRVFATKEKELASDYFTNLFPWYRAERTTLERSRRLLADVGESNPFLARMLLEANDELERAIRCRELARRE